MENIYRHHQLGKPPLAAAVHGTQEVWGAVLASTLTTLAVFIPVLFVQEEAGQLFRDIALAISCGIALSLIVSITVIPTAAARLVRSQASCRQRRARVSPDDAHQLFRARNGKSPSRGVRRVVCPGAPFGIAQEPAEAFIAHFHRRVRRSWAG